MKQAEATESSWRRQVNHHCLRSAETQGRQSSGEVLLGGKERLQVCPDWRLLTWEVGGRLTRSGVSSVTGEGSIWLACAWPKVGSRDKNYGNRQLFVKSWPYWAGCYGRYCLAPCIVTRDLNVASPKSDLEQAAFLGHDLTVLGVSPAPGSCSVWSLL